VLIVGLSFISSGLVTAQTFQILHRFGGSDGATPYAGLILSAKTLYGATQGGGTAGNGTVFAVKTDGTGFQTLHTFTAGGDNSSGIYTNSEGAELEAGMVLSGNILYGAAANGGSLGFGTVFAVGTNGSGFRTLHTFAGYPSDGANPRASLVLINDTLYGTTAGGGSSESGTVFAINTDGTRFHTLHSFAAGADDSNSYYTNSDGVSPWSGLLMSGHTLFGTAVAGGSSGNGTVFAINIDGTDFTNLHSFSAGSGTAGAYGTNSDGINPWAGLILTGGTVYGTAASGGISGNGTVFSINTDGTGFTTLHSFIGSDGAAPYAGLILSANRLYGTTSGGGSSSFGTVFAINTDGTGFTNLYSLSGGYGGVFPYDRLVLSGYTLYGSASDYFSDPSGYGKVFSLSFPPQLTIVPSRTSVILSWPTNCAGFDYTSYILQSTTNLGASAIWTTNLPAPVVVNSQNTVTNPISGPQKFYRLGQ
jgi:uncharacterized repeat protein (TIGR03803 family)